MNYKTASFLDHSRLLFTLAYTMLADVAAAEQLLAEVYLEWRTGQLTGRATKIDFVREIIMRCIDGPSGAGSLYFTSFQSALYFSLSPGITALLMKLNARDRALFILREVFAYDYREISVALEQPEDECREQYRLVMEHLGGKDGIYAAALAVHERIIHQFMRGILERDAAVLARCLSEDVRLLADVGGSSMVVRAQGLAEAPHPIRGRTKVSDFIFQTLDRLLASNPNFHWEIAITNQLPCIISYIGNDAVCLQSFECDGERIRAIYVQVSIEKLAGLRKR